MKRRRRSSDLSYAAATSAPSLPTLDPKVYTVAWIAPLEIEAQAALHMLDRRHRGRFPVSRGDDYVFHAGEMGGHNIVIATLPAGQEYGTGSSAALASQLKRFFPNLWFGLLVGVAAGLPDLSRRPPRDIRLGDVLVGLPDGESAGLVAYDLGRETIDGFRPLRYGHVLAATEPIVRSAIGSIKIEAPNEASLFLPFFETIREKEHPIGNFDDPGQDHDVLYDDQAYEVRAPIKRTPRSPSRRTQVFYGPIGSGDKLLKNSQKRNELRDKYGVIGLEMEAAGTMNRIPVGVIRGVCDYGDYHKNKEWQPYAAAMAAAYAKAIIYQIPPVSYADHLHDKEVTEEAKTAEAELMPKTVHHKIPLSQNPRFTGRSDVLEELEQKLFIEKQCSAMAIVGLGGMGKTQVALHFAYRIQELHPEYSIFWIALVSEATFEQSYADIAGELDLLNKETHSVNQSSDGIPTIRGSQNKKAEDSDTKKIVCRHLCSSLSGKWLLILDNADDQEFVFGSSQRSGIVEYLPKSDNGRILMTTRSREVATSFVQTDIITLKEMTKGHSLSLFNSSLIGHAEDEFLVMDLLDDLAYMPLAITQAAAYLNRTQIPLRKYLKLLQGAETDMIGLLSREFRDTTRYPISRKAIATTWLVSFDQIQRSSKDAVNLLYFVSCIEPKAIPQSILPNSQALETEEAIALLCGYSFLSRRGSDDIFDMHSLVHMAIKLWRDKHSQTERAASRTISHLAEVIPHGEPSNRLAWREYLPHALRALDASSDLAVISRYDLLGKMGLCLSIDGRYQEAMKCYEEVLEWAKRPSVADVELQEVYQSNIAVVHSALGRHDLAIGILKPMVTMMRETRETQQRLDTQQLDVEQKLASAYLSELRAEEAIEILEPMVQFKEGVYHEEHPSLLRSQHELAGAYLCSGQMQRAIALFEHVVDIRKRKLDKEDPVRLDSERLLADAYLKSGLVQRAIELYEPIVKVEGKVLEKEDPSYLTTQHNLASAYLDDGQVQRAINLFESIAEIKKRKLGKTDPRRVATEFEMGRAYLAAKQTKMAIKLFESVVDVSLKKEHRTVRQRWLAEAYLDDGQVEKSISLLEHVTMIEQGVLADETSRISKINLLEKAHQKLRGMQGNISRRP